MHLERQTDETRQALGLADAKFDTLQVHIDGVWVKVDVGHPIRVRQQTKLLLRTETLPSALDEFPDYFVDMEKSVLAVQHEVEKGSFLADAFFAEFPGGVAYDKFIVGTYIKLLKLAPSSTRDAFRNAGRTDEGLWATFVESMEMNVLDLCDDVEYATVPIKQERGVKREADGSSGSSAAGTKRKADEEVWIDLDEEDEEAAFLRVGRAAGDAKRAKGSSGAAKSGWWGQGPPSSEASGSRARR